MANFPQLLTPITSGGLQSTGLQQKPVDLNPIIEGLQKERLSAASKPKAAKNAGKDDLKVNGLQGEVMHVWQRHQKAKAIMGGLLDTFGELALDLPQFKEASNITSQDHSDHADKIRVERKHQFDEWHPKLLTPDTYGVRANDLYNVKRAMKGNLMKQQKQAEEIKYSPTGNYSDDVWEISTQHDRHAQEWLNNYFDPAAKAFRSDASAKVFKHQLAGDDVAGIMTSKHSWSSNEKALKTAYLGALEQAGFEVGEDKSGKPTIGKWRPSNPNSAIQGGMIQDLLSHLNAENNPEFKNKDGSFNFEKFADVATPIARQRINNALERRINIDKDETKSFQKPSDWELQQYGETTKLLTEATLPPINVPHTIAIQEDFFSRENLVSGLGGGIMSDMISKMLGGKDFGLPTGEDKLNELVYNGVLQRSIVDGKDVYSFTKDATSNLAAFSAKASKSGNIQMANAAQTLKESLEVQKNAKINPDVTGGVFNNASISVRNLPTLQEKVKKNMDIAGDASTALDGKTVSIAGNLLSGSQFKGFVGKIVNLSTATATMPNFKGSNFVKGVPIYATADAAEPTANIGYAKYDEKLKKWIASPKEMEGGVGGRLQFLVPDSDEWQFCKQQGQLSTETPRTAKNSTHFLGMGATYKAELTPEEKKRWSQMKISSTVNVPDIKNPNLYKSETEIADKLLRDKRLYVRTGLDKEVGLKEMDKELKNAGLNEEQLKAVKRLNYDPDAVGRFLFVSKNGTATKYENKRIATDIPMFDLETDAFAPEAGVSIEEEEIKNSKGEFMGKNKTMFMPMNIDVTDYVIQDAENMRDKNSRKKTFTSLGIVEDANGQNSANVYNTNSTPEKGSLKGAKGLPPNFNNPAPIYTTGAKRQ